MLYAMKTYTSQNGERTTKHVVGHSALTIQGKNPDYDYSFRQRKDIDDGGGEDIYGWMPIKEGNESGESFSLYPGQKRTGASKTMNYMDTIACRRRKEVSSYFKSEEDRKYNSQVALVRDASKRAKAAFRNMNEDIKVTEKVKFKGPGMTQRVGPTEGPEQKSPRISMDADSVVHGEGN